MSGQSTSSIHATLPFTPASTITITIVIPYWAQDGTVHTPVSVDTPTPTHMHVTIPSSTPHLTPSRHLPNPPPLHLLPSCLLQLPLSLPLKHTSRLPAILLILRIHWKPDQQVGSFCKRENSAGPPYIERRSFRRICPFRHTLGRYLARLVAPRWPADCRGCGHWDWSRGSGRGRSAYPSLLDARRVRPLSKRDRGRSHACSAYLTRRRRRSRSKRRQDSHSRLRS